MSNEQTPNERQPTISPIKNVAFWLGPIIALLVFYTLGENGWGFHAQIVGAITSLCALWWVFEPIPIPVTSLIPIAVFPMTGVMSNKEVGQAYGHYLILLLMGGFIISQAMEKSGSHKRLAFGMINLFGGKGKRLVFGFMAASAFLSMWISNTATTLMLLPITYCLGGSFASK
jgi:sodium-dependent dicarboxylate transporter 2/3/5